MRSLILIAAIALLAGCAGPGPIVPGETREAVLARWGAPQRVVRMPSGERLQYSLQPSGRYAWMVDVDASGRVVRATQALTEANFHRIVPGEWTLADVEREFGPPAWIESVASWRGPILTYRWRDNTNTDMFYFVYLDEAHVVRRAHPGMEFRLFPFDRS